MHCSALAALAMHGLWGVQCAAELLNNVHGEAGGRRGCEVPEFQLAGTGKGRGEFGCGNGDGDGDDGCESAWSRGEEGRGMFGKGRKG
jgi:hypothetical protein